MTRPLTIMLCAGEPSGDALGGDLMAELRRLHPGVRLIGVGGRLVDDEYILRVNGQLAALRGEITAINVRAESMRKTPMGILSRGVSGIAGQTLIVNFPGSPKAVEELFPVIAPTLRHVVATLSGDGRH